MTLDEAIKRMEDLSESNRKLQIYYIGKKNEVLENIHWARRTSYSHAAEILKQLKEESK